MYQLGIYCVESEWDKKEYEISAAPALKTLADRHGAEFEYKQSSQTRDFLDYLKCWSGQGGEFSILYIGSHGAPGKISLSSKNDVNLEQIASHFEEEGLYDNTNCIIHFWSCSTLRASEEEIDMFLHRTKFEAISGYRIDVEWIEPLAFDLLYLQYLMSNVPEDGLTSEYIERARFAMQEYTWYGLGSSMGFTIQTRRD